VAQNRTNNTSTYPNRPLSSACHAATENANQSIRLGNRREGGNCRRPEVQGGPGHAGIARNQRQRAHVSTAPIPSHPTQNASSLALSLRLRSATDPARPAAGPTGPDAAAQSRASTSQISPPVAFDSTGQPPTAFHPIHPAILLPSRSLSPPREASERRDSISIPERLLQKRPRRRSTHTHTDTDRQNRRWGFQIPERISPQVEGKLLPPRRDLQFVLLQRR
jgi:hypothetical protein